jgi:hypothetical protein
MLAGSKQWGAKKMESFMPHSKKGLMSGLIMPKKHLSLLNY